MQSHVCRCSLQLGFRHVHVLMLHLTVFPAACNTMVTTALRDNARQVSECIYSLELMTQYCKHRRLVHFSYNSQQDIALPERIRCKLPEK